MSYFFKGDVCYNIDMTQSSDRELAFTPIIELAEMIRSKNLSPVELTEAVFRRIAAFNPTLHAFLTVVEEEAIERAKKAEQDAVKGRYWGPLHGMPAAIKDLYDTAGIRTTYGSLAHENHVPTNDGLLAKRLKAAGSIIVGKTNTAEYGCSTSTENRLIDACRNPWDIDRSSGGSSGGAGVAIAAGLCPVSPGSDGGGSVRIPSALCGVFGIKPTYGRVPYDADAIYGPGIPFICHGPITRTVKDAAFLLNILSGHDPEDHNSINGPPPDFLKPLDGISLSRQKPLKIAWGPDLGFARPDPEVHVITEKAVRLFESAGHHVEIDHPGIEAPFTTWENLASAANDLMLGHHLTEHADELTSYFKTSLIEGKNLKGADIIKGWIQVTEWKKKLAEFFSRYDLLMTPTTAVPAYPVGISGRGPGEGMIDWSLTPYTPLFNFTHNPAASVPCGFTTPRESSSIQDGPQKRAGPRDGPRKSSPLPVGLQIVGDIRNETTVLQAAFLFEQLQPWADNFPPVS